ncbi:MAG: peptidoglycan DD-metalloendopeptidase family protein [Rhodobacteraceae bacterium]|nr:peptidoglycan DD-metalloendopeptidase family protein [Paracoccaceae bacterium]
MRKFLFFLLVLLTSPAVAQSDPVLALRAASEDIRMATTALAAAEANEDRVAALSNTIRSLETGLGSLRLALRASIMVAKQKQNAIAQNRGEMGNLLATLAALENTPVAFRILHPAGATASARAAMILSAITPTLRAQAEKLRAELATIEALNALHDEALANIRTALETLKQARRELAAAIRADQPAPENPANLLDNLEQLVRASEDLGGLATALGSRLSGAAPLSETQLLTLRGTLPLPVSGTIVRSYNQPNGIGIRQPGILLTAPALSLVLAPQAGIVRFAGGLLEYGQVVILEPAPEQLQIYAGFGQVYVNTGDVLESGAALGLLGGEIPDSAEFLAESTGENDKGAESLYIEIRENGIPVDPLTWFAVN